MIFCAGTVVFCIITLLNTFRLRGELTYEEYDEYTRLNMLNIGIYIGFIIGLLCVHILR